METLVGDDAIQALEQQLAAAQLRQRRAEAELNDITLAAREGDLIRVPLIPGLRKEQADAGCQIKSLQAQITAARADQLREQRQRDRARLIELFSQMEQARQQIIEHCRSAALLLGELHAVLGKQAITIGNDLGAPTGGMWPHDQTRVRELLSPISPFQPWKVDTENVMLGFEHCVRVYPLKKRTIV